MAECANDADPIITTTHGKVRGKLRETVYGDHFYCFDGIPYAKPPLGELRFRSPQPVEPWLDIRDCTEVTPKCIQYNRYTNTIEGSEDCLYLNIYAKKLKSEKLLPVMVYIYGGIYQTGSASRLALGPDYFMMKDVILVTISYRLGALGFLSFPEPELQVPGNSGLKDIVLSLKWLKQNYQNFNGDPENVTLFGHSSGGMAASILCVSPQCKGLFTKAIFLSGVALSTEILPSLTYRFAKYVGYEGADDNKNVLNYLLGLEAAKFCDLRSLFTPEENDQGKVETFMPTVEGPNVTDAIIPKHILDMMSDQEEWSRNIPVILGATSIEALVRYNLYMVRRPHLFETLKVRPDYLNSSEVKNLCDEEEQMVLIKKIIKLHMGDKELNAENIMDMLLMLSYGFMYHPIHRYLASRLKHAKAPTYLYRFDYDSPDFNLSRFKVVGREVRGCCHVSDLSSIFYLPQSFKLNRDSKDYKMIEQMIGLLTAFAANSDPNCDSIKPVVWEPLPLKETRKCLNISNENTFIDWPEYEKCQMWDQFYSEVGLRLF